MNGPEARAWIAEHDVTGRGIPDKALAGLSPAHVLVRLASGSVFYAEPVTWEGKDGRTLPICCS